MASHSSPFDHHFQKLLALHQRGEAEDLFAELLHHGPSLCNPLADFLLKHPPAPELSILLDLLSKCMDDRAIPLLMRFLDSGVPELRRAAANGLGWHRARAALEALDELEGNDPHEAVRFEARLAIDEILQDFPKLHSLLHYHQPDPRTAAAAEPGQRLELVRCLPRLLAIKYKAVPVHISAGEVLHLAVSSGSETRLASTLEALTGHTVQLHSWTPERIQQAIDGLYSFGDDDFCTFPASLTPAAREEIIEVVLSGVRPAEPASPLPETSDAVEVVQAFLASCEFMKLEHVEIFFEPPSMTLQGRGGGKDVYTLDPPPEALRERFLTALRIVARLEPGGGRQRRQHGAIECRQHEPHFTAHLDSEAGDGRETLRVHLARTNGEGGTAPDA